MQNWVSEFLEWCDRYGIEVPREEEKLLEVEKLLINGKRIDFVHPHIIKLKKLTILQITNANLKTLPPLPKSLKKLAIAKNPLGELPNAISELENLEVLLMEHCGINKLPSWIKELKKLMALKIDGNGLRSIEELKGMPGLELLTMNNNYIKDFTPIYSLKNLITLEFSKNRIEAFDGRIRSLKRLETFIGFENPITKWDTLFFFNIYKTDIRLDLESRGMIFLPRSILHFGEKFPKVAKVVASLVG